MKYLPSILVVPHTPSSVGEFKISQLYLCSNYLSLNKFCLSEFKTEQNCLQVKEGKNNRDENNFEDSNQFVLNRAKSQSFCS